ncbi:MAG: hypothetical protein WCA89_12775, partial [Terracidiphilus sp.]
MMREKLEALAVRFETTRPGLTDKEIATELRAILAAEPEDLESDAQTLRGYIKTHGETPAMTWSTREHWKKRAERAEADVEKLKMDAEHLQYERDEAREGAKAEAGEPNTWDRGTRPWTLAQW